MNAYGSNLDNISKRFQDLGQEVEAIANALKAIDPSTTNEEELKQIHLLFECLREFANDGFWLFIEAGRWQTADWIADICKDFSYSGYEDVYEPNTSEEVVLKYLEAENRYFEQIDED